MSDHAKVLRTLADRMSGSYVDKATRLAREEAQAAHRAGADALDVLALAEGAQLLPVREESDPEHIRGAHIRHFPGGNPDVTQILAARLLATALALLRTP